MTKSNIGTFAFRNEGDGCLTAKWTNENTTEGPFAEACKFLNGPSPTDSFCGNYHTSWIEDNLTGVDCRLLISRDPNNQRMFKLIWTNKNNPNEVYFEGIGMLFEGYLVGAYWD